MMIGGGAGFFQGPLAGSGTDNFCFKGLPGRIREGPGPDGRGRQECERCEHGEGKFDEGRNFRRIIRSIHQILGEDLAWDPLKLRVRRRKGVATLVVRPLAKPGSSL